MSSNNASIHLCMYAFMYLDKHLIIFLKIKLLNSIMKFDNYL